MALVSRSPRPSRTRPKSAPLIRASQSGIHGQGVFAARLIPSGTRVVEYVGERITKAEAARREQARLRRLARGADGSVYIFYLNRRHDLDGLTKGNVARWINHSCKPNCRAENAAGRIWLIARRDIAEGEELSFDYGYAYSEWRQHLCRCGSVGCVGFIVNAAQRWRVRRTLREEKRSIKAAARLKPAPK